MDVNDGLNEENEGYTYIGEVQDINSDTREYQPGRKNIRKLAESSDLDDNNLFEIYIYLLRKSLCYQQRLQAIKRELGENIERNIEYSMMIYF